jgi:ABC-type multidrug transport system fused ATPase/permease subunit
MAGSERVLEILDTSPDLHDFPAARPAPPLRGHVVFDHVSFAYEPGRSVLHDMSFEAEPGSIIALVGTTGSGKTTTLGMIPRFYDPTEGSVLIDGEDVRNYTLRSLRSQISLVLQEPVLFRSSIFDNIAYGNPDATEHDVYLAAEAANAMEFIHPLPERFDMIVGERGSSLSGGQRQRIAIARAIVRNAPILILDEPTVGLDAETEALVLEALARLMEGRTTFVIAHHLSTIHRADKILVLQGGRIVESGSHEELLLKKGWYAQVYTKQVQAAAAPLGTRSSIA